MNNFQGCFKGVFLFLLVFHFFGGAGGGGGWISYFTKQLSLLVKGVYLFCELNTYYFDRAPQGQLLKQNVHRKLLQEEVVLKTFTNFTYFLKKQLIKEKKGHMSHLINMRVMINQHRNFIMWFYLSNSQQNILFFIK